uniref:Uncharacterized protein n=1 Tax=Brassica oleracea var. oleracea TaxID=109376 RepID=A0A0D3BH49_BRAOL
MFGEPGSRLYPSSSAPGSSTAPGSSSAPCSSGPETVPETQSSQRVSRSPFSSAPHVPLPMAPPTMPPPVPPPMAPPMPAEIHPDLMVPPSAPYSQYTVKDLLRQRGREGLPFIDPDRPDGTLWLGIDNCLASDVTDTIKGYFSMSHPDWRKTWFKIYAQKYHWSMGVTERVRKQFYANAKVCLLDMDGLQLEGDIVLCSYMEDEVTALRRESEQLRRESARMRNEMDSTRSAFTARMGGLKGFLDVVAATNPEW